MAIEINKAKELVIRAGHELQETGLIARTWGNISARISKTQFVITPSGLAYDTLTPDKIVPVNIKDLSWEGDVKPSSEKGVHAAAYALRPDVDFVIHTHQDYATDMAAIAKPLNVAKIDPEAEAVLGPVVPTAGYGLSSTKTLTENVRKCIDTHKNSRAVLMRNHGTVCMGKDYDDAFNIAHVLEKVSKKKFLELAGGAAPEDTVPGYRLSNYSKIYRREIHEEYDAFYEIFDNPKVGCVIVTTAPWIRQYSAFGSRLVPCVDDIAQIIGMNIPCIRGDASPKEIAKALPGDTAAVLLKGVGAVCTAGSLDDAGAVVCVLDKGCQAGILEKAGAHPHAVSFAAGNLEHMIYVNKYSKLKDSKQKA